MGIKVADITVKLNVSDEMLRSLIAAHVKSLVVALGVEWARKNGRAMISKIYSDKRYTSTKAGRMVRAEAMKALLAAMKTGEKSR